jgi:hypothetical protein
VRLGNSLAVETIGLRQTLFNKTPPAGAGGVLFRLITNFRPWLASVAWGIFWLRLRKSRRRISWLQRVVSMACFARS